ncbi:Vma22p NDAI_0D01720 [Naumovozyma dairenensis CBS 421]|uniref:Vacuolar ATPase assembly protein VMA22 n=1 Tax=Naumovozyma dairenensis (strain ATCC 10597 / BCRC 20456 / CBS 421 / NBRC 0211 / NRRL Y-12639) TaxID=1071378 RepID=G0W9M5_NAUDC|nr:hypothetical protein NDAI_0D01720 [Naumovozyma dairenensis CBS 421]CCD24486.1 hypothetical protein NDAI_0D01720 [Naumovozyma dairenensis CBS 421]
MTNSKQEIAKELSTPKLLERKDDDTGNDVNGDGDDPYIHLLNLLSRYDQLLEQLSNSISTGFHNLSRANYHNKDSLNGRYGKDYWDESYVGEITVEITQPPPEQQSLQQGIVHIVRKKLHTDEKADIIVEETDDDDDDTKDKLKNRKEKTNKREEKKDNDDTKKKDVSYDPILMFGGALSIPSSLRQCQTNFKGCIPLFSDLISCRMKIDRLVTKLEADKKANSTCAI